MEYSRYIHEIGVPDACVIIGKIIGKIIVPCQCVMI
jgi:hypothetical protein